MEEFATKVKQIRKSNNLSQERFGEKVGVSRQIVSKWEQGKVKPSTYNIAVISRLFNVDTKELLGIEEVQKENKDEKKEVEVKETLVSNNKKSINLKKTVLLIILFLFCIYLAWGLKNFIFIMKIHKNIQQYKKLDSYSFNINYFKDNLIYKDTEVDYKDSKYIINRKEFNSDNQEKYNIQEEIDLSTNQNKTVDLISNSEINKEENINWELYKDGQYLYNSLPGFLNSEFTDKIKYIIFPWKLDVKNEKEFYKIKTKSFIMEIDKNSNLPSFYCFYENSTSNDPVIFYYKFKM